VGVTGVPDKRRETEATASSASAAIASDHCIRAGIVAGQRERAKVSIAVCGFSAAGYGGHTDVREFGTARLPDVGRQLR
jgi:hypothetical protein